MKPTDQQKIQTRMAWLAVEALTSETWYQRAALSIPALQMEKMHCLLLGQGVRLYLSKKEEPKYCLRHSETRNNSLLQNNHPSYQGFVLYFWTALFLDVLFLEDYTGRFLVLCNI